MAIIRVLHQLGVAEVSMQAMYNLPGSAEYL